MRKKERIKKKISNYFFDHRFQYLALHEIYLLFMCCLSGILFAFGFACFITTYDADELRIVTGGISGICQNIILILEMCGIKNATEGLIYSILYFSINIPLIVFAFFKLSKRFAIYSAIAVALSSIFVTIFSNSIGNQMGMSQVLINSPITRAIIAGACSGVSAAIAFKNDISCGGLDIITYYCSFKKSTSIGKYGLIFNGIVLVLYILLLWIKGTDQFSTCLLTLFFSLVYQFVDNLVIDAIHTRNKKSKVEIITTNLNLTDILLSLFPHSATINDAVGAYSNSKKICINMVVSSSEVKKVVEVCRKADESSFVMVIPLRQVYGNFFTRPLQ